MKTGEEFGLILVVAESGVEGWYARAHGTCDVVVGVAARRRRRLGRGARLLVMAFFPFACYNISYVVLLYWQKLGWIASVASAAACL